MTGRRVLIDLDPATLRPGRVLVRNQVTHARLSVPVIRAAFGSGLPRIEWSGLDVASSEREVGSLLMDMRRLDRASTSNSEIIKLAKKYGPLRVGRSGVPGSFTLGAALTGTDRFWEDADAQTAWADQLLGISAPVDTTDDDAFSADEPTSDELDYVFEDRRSAQWEPLEAWRAYSRVLNTVLSIAGDLIAGREVPLVRFADTWSPATRQLSTMEWSRPEPPPIRPGPFDIADPRAWNVPDFARAWWWELEESLETPEARTIEARRALSWILNCLADSAGLRINQVWPENTQQAFDTTAPFTGSSDARSAPTYVLAPDPRVRFPTEWPTHSSEITWSVWSVAVSQLHAAVMSERGWLECDSCGFSFPIGEGRRHPRPGNPTYCGEECRKVGAAARRSERAKSKTNAVDATAVLTAVSKRRSRSPVIDGELIRR